jgi:hypothetical protein
MVYWHLEIWLLAILILGDGILRIRKPVPSLAMVSYFRKPGICIRLHT